MTPHEQEIAYRIEHTFENLAQDLDQIANKWELNSEEMTVLIQKWGNFSEYYGEWMHESWEKQSPDAS